MTIRNRENSIVSGNTMVIAVVSTMAMRTAAAVGNGGNWRWAVAQNQRSNRAINCALMEE